LLNSPMHFTTFYLLTNCQTIEINIFAMKKHWEIQQAMNPPWELKTKSDSYFVEFADYFFTKFCMLVSWQFTSMQNSV